MSDNSIIEYFIHVCEGANERILSVYNSDDFNVNLKSDNSPLTLADKESSDYICKCLKEWDPSIPIVCEETKL